MIAAHHIPVDAGAYRKPRETRSDMNAENGVAAKKVLVLEESQMTQQSFQKSSMQKSEVSSVKPPLPRLKEFCVWKAKIAHQLKLNLV